MASPDNKKIVESVSISVNDVHIDTIKTDNSLRDQYEELLNGGSSKEQNGRDRRKDRRKEERREKKEKEKIRRNIRDEKKEKTEG